MLLNPAATGTFDGYERAVLNHKSQWVTTGAKYRTTSASFDMTVMKEKKSMAHLGAGVYFYNDMAGDAKMGMNQLGISLSGILQLGQMHKAAAGLHFGGMQRSAQTNNLEWGSQYNGYKYDPSLSSNESNSYSSLMYADVGTGLFYEFSNSEGSVSEHESFKISAGIAALHFNKPGFRNSGNVQEQLHRKWVALVNAHYDLIGSPLSIAPSLLYVSQGPSSEALFGMLLHYRLSQGSKITNYLKESSIAFGFHYRLKDALIPQIYVQFADFGFGISYDVNISKLSSATASRGGIEVSIKYVNLHSSLYKSRR